MEEELMTAISIPVTLIFLMTTLSAIFVGTRAIKGSFNGYITSLDMAVVNAYDSELQSLSDYKKPLPAAVVYSTLLKNQSLVSSISGSAVNRNGTTVNVTSINSLANLFDSKVKINVTKNISGMYDVEIVGV